LTAKWIFAGYGRIREHAGDSGALQRDRNDQRGQGG